jgi:hypothetical protein
MAVKSTYGTPSNQESRSLDQSEGWQASSSPYPSTEAGTCVGHQSHFVVS